MYYFTRLLGVITKMNHYHSALVLFNKMCFLGIPFNHYTMTIAINCYCHLNLPGFAFSVLGSFFKRGYTPELPTFTVLIRGPALADRTPDAVNLFRKLIREKICKPDGIMFDTIVDGFCKAGQTMRATRLIKLMEQVNCKADAMVYIANLCKDRLVDKALDLFSEMIGKGFAPDVFTYTSLVQGLCSLRRWDDVVKKFEEMSALGISPNVYTFNILVDAYCKEGKMKDAEFMFHSMTTRGINPTVVTYSALIDGYSFQRKMDKAMDWFSNMNDNNVFPNTITYNSLISG